MGVRAYLVEKTIGEEVFNCYSPNEWHERLLRLGKFDNGVWMEFTEEDLEEMENDPDYALTEAERQIVEKLRRLLEAREAVYVEYF